MYLLIDGENLDATLGVNILKRAPRAEERPRWDRVLEFDPWAAHQLPDLADVESGTGEQPESDALTTPGGTDVVRESDQSGSTENRTTNGLFYLNATSKVAMSFVQALLAIGWQPLLLTSEDPAVKVVDLGIQKTLTAIADAKPGADIVLGSHDVDYLPQIEMLLERGHRVSILCFREFLAAPLAELEDRGVRIFDLEFDVKAFNIPLHRVYPIDVADFDPYIYL